MVPGWYRAPPSGERRRLVEMMRDFESKSDPRQRETGPQWYQLLLLDAQRSARWWVRRWNSGGSEWTGRLQ